ncbi:MAG TPA: hypothetical protein VM577_05370 [Anaerovoracaceae bacterium]|nr:hypothetical protein [Anaerovoracaceae bacterium]
MKRVLGLLIAASCVFSAGFLYEVMTTGMVSPPVAETLTPAPASIVELPELKPFAELPQAIPVTPPVKVSRLPVKKEVKEEPVADAGEPEHHCVQKELVTGGTVMVCEYE